MIPMPDTAFARFWVRLPAATKQSFFAGVVMGLVCHLYLFTNLIPNHDAVFHLFQCDYGTASGRWFLPLVLAWDGDYNMPWLQGILSLLCLAGTVCITTRLLRIEKPLAIVITAALCTAFPTVAATFTYMFTADAYFFGLFLAALAAYAVWRMPIWGLPLGTILLILSMGIYQSYFPVAAVLMVGALLFDCLDGRASFGRTLLRGVKMVATLALGIVVYMAVARLATMASGGLSDYMGISSMGSLSLSELPELVRQSLESYETYFLQNELGWNFSFIPLLVIAAWVSGVVLLATLLLRRQVGVLRGLLALVLVLLYPLAGSLIHIMVAGAAVHDLMIYGLLYALILPLALASFAATHADEMGSLLRSALQSLMSWIVIASMALTAYNYIVTDNKAYLKMALGFTQIEAYSNRLATMIQSVPGYSPSLAVVLVGSSNGDALLDVTPELSEIFLTGALNMGTYRTQYSYGNLLNRFSALPNYVYLDDMPEEVSSAIAGVSETMPAYPQEGCVQIAGEYIVVRLN